MEFPISKRGFQFQKMNESGEWWTRVGLEAALDGLVLQGSFSPNSDQRISTVGWNVPQDRSEMALYLRYSTRNILLDLMSSLFLQNKRKNSGVLIYHTLYVTAKGALY